MVSTPIEDGQSARARPPGEQNQAVVAERSHRAGCSDRSSINRADVVEVYYSSDDDDEGSVDGGDGVNGYSSRRRQGFGDKDGSSDDDDDDDDDSTL